MPLFFVLSGFCMTLAYGKKNYAGSTLCSDGWKIAKNSQNCQGHSTEEAFDSIGFYLARFARILPVYYICFLVGAILIPFGHTNIAAPSNVWFNGGGSILSIFLAQTWVLIFGFGPNEPSWTVSTLFFFYLVYPRYVKNEIYLVFDICRVPC